MTPAPVFLALLLCLFPAYGSAANEIIVYGTVADQNDTPVPGAFITMISDADTVQTTSMGDGSYEVYLNKTTSIDERPESYAISLSQNYPNPFNPSTIITYEIGRASQVRLDVYSILGQHVCTLENNMMPPGTHRVRWEGYDTNGQRVAAGVYLYLLRVNSHSLTRKMVLLDGNNIPAPSTEKSTMSPKTTIVPAGKKYLVTAEKGNMYHYSGIHTIYLDQESVNLDITMPDIYQPYFLFASSGRHNDEFIYAGDSILYGLVAHAETVLPDSCEIVITTLYGDEERLTLTGNNYFTHSTGECYKRFFSSASQGTMETAPAESPTPYNGILEVNAENDSVTAVPVFPAAPEFESLSAEIAVIDTVEIIEILDNSFILWNNTYYVGSNTGTDWMRIDTDIIMVHFRPDVTDVENSDFIESNNLTFKKFI